MVDFSKYPEKKDIGLYDSSNLEFSSIGRGRNPLVS